MKVHIFQHVPFEGPACIEQWARERRAELTWTRFYEPEWALPEAAGPDLLVVMGGPMSVNETDQYPWLEAERAIVAARIARDLPTLGICLGAQQIAAATGCRVYRAPEREIGWFPVSGHTVDSPAFRFPDQFPALHWHGEMFDLPEDAVWLASTEACPHQAFQLGRRVLALQFHLEATPESVRALVRHAAADLDQPGPYVQDSTRIVEPPPEYFADSNRLMRQVLDYLVS